MWFGKGVVVRGRAKLRGGDMYTSIARFERATRARRGHDVHAGCCPRDGRYQTVLRRSSGACSAFTSLNFRCSRQIVKLAVHT